MGHVCLRPRHAVILHFEELGDVRLNIRKNPPNFGALCTALRRCKVTKDAEVPKVPKVPTE